MGFTPQDIGEYVLGEFALLNAAATTAGTAVNGKAIDRRANGSHYVSAKILVPIQYKLSSGTPIVITANLQHGATTTAYSNIGSTAAFTTITGATGGSSGYAVLAKNVDITNANRYLRVRITPDCNVVSSVQFCNYSGIVLLGGADAYPAA